MHPVLFRVGSYSVHSFGVLLMLAFAAAVYRAYKATERAHAKDPNAAPEAADLLDVSVWLILAGVLGARALFVALDWDHYKSHPGTWFAIWEGGISFHGALLGGIIVRIGDDQLLDLVGVVVRGLLNGVQHADAPAVRDRRVRETDDVRTVLLVFAGIDYLHRRRGPQHGAGCAIVTVFCLLREKRR